MGLVLGLGLVLGAWGQSPDSGTAWKARFGAKTVAVEVRRISGGAVLVPLKPVLDLLGYQTTECGRCGHDEVLPLAPARADRRGAALVLWGEPQVLWAGNGSVDLLDAPSERVEGVTWTSVDLFRRLGFTVTVSPGTLGFTRP